MITLNTSNNLTSQTISNANCDEKVVKLWLHGKSTTTIDTYSRNLKNFFSSHNLPLNLITLDTLIEYQNNLIEKGLAVTTVNNRLNTIKSLLTFSYKIGYINLNVGVLVKSMKIREEINSKILSEQQIKLLITNAKSARDSILIKLLANSGLRISELINLKFSDLKNGKLTIFGKGQKTRFIPVKKDLEKELLKLQRPYTDLIFYSKNGTPLRRNNINTMLKKVAVSSGISQNVSVHQLRHSMASFALRNGCTLSMIQETLGHSSLATTSRYLHTLDNDSATNYVNF